jgi:hypothetical protein
MDEPTLRRITIEREEDWIRVQQDVDKALISTMGARLATLPGGKDGAAAKGVRRELELRIKKVSHPNLIGDQVLMVDTRRSV